MYFYCILLLSSALLHNTNFIFDKFLFQKCLTTLDLTSLGVGSCVGTGMYLVSGMVARTVAGPGVILSFIIAAVASIFSGEPFIFFFYLTVALYTQHDYVNVGSAADGTSCCVVSTFRLLRLKALLFPKLHSHFSTWYTLTNHHRIVIGLGIFV